MPSVTHVRVRYKDTDTMSVVYYGNYLTYFEVGRVEYLRQAGWPMSRVNERVHMPVVEAHVKYVKPARLDDLLAVTSWVSERKRASFTFSYEIKNEATDLVATGHTRHACWDPATSRMIAIPEWLAGIMPDGDLELQSRRR
jgi:acyl-CoA thioester hydrolase